MGIDLDHCIADDKLLPGAQEIVDRFHTTYIEISPSGTGIRIFCLLPNGFTYDTQTYYIKKGNIEVYIPGHTNRFLTITGNALTDADVVEVSDALAWLLDTYMRRPTPPTPTVAVPGESYLSKMPSLQKPLLHTTEKSSVGFRRVTLPGTKATAKRMPHCFPSWHSGAAVTWHRWTGCSGSPA